MGTVSAGRPPRLASRWLTSSRSAATPKGPRGLLDTAKVSEAPRICLRSRSAERPVRRRAALRFRETARFTLVVVDMFISVRFGLCAESTVRLRGKLRNAEILVADNQANLTLMGFPTKAMQERP